MITNSRELLEQAQILKYAVPQFNINNLEWTRFILEACEEEKSPVILGVSEGAAKYMGGFSVVVAIVRELVNNLEISIPVVIHLDHGSSVQKCKEAVEAGFTSIMLDASKETLENNVKFTKEIVEYAHQKNITVEAEIGHIGEEDGNSSEIAYATVEDAYLLSQTNIDSLAPAIGSVHGIYKGEPKLDFERIKNISNQTKIPLVLHGGTGIDDEKIKRAIDSGIVKVNINTELQLVWSEAVRIYLKENETVYDPRKIIKAGEKSIKNAIIKKIELLGSKHKA